MTYDEYWGDFDEKQSRVLRMVETMVQLNTLSAIQIAGSYPTMVDYTEFAVVDNRRVQDIATLVVNDPEQNYRSLISESYLILLGNPNIHEAFEYEVMYSYALGYKRLQDGVAKIYQEVVDKQNDDYGYTNNSNYDWWSTILPHGITPSRVMEVEMRHRVRRIVNTIFILKRAGEGLNLLNPAISNEMRAARNALLRNSSQVTVGVDAGWHGILDFLGTSHVGFNSFQETFMRDGSFKFFGITDDRQTDACRALTGRVFQNSQAIWGVNVPPILNPPHPCRSWIEFL